MERHRRVASHRLAALAARFYIMIPAHDPSAEAGSNTEQAGIRWDAVTFSRTTIDAAHMDGVPCIRGLRIPIATVVGMLADGMGAGEILDAFPDLEPDDVTEALRYAAEAVREQGLPLASTG